MCASRCCLRMTVVFGRLPLHRLCGEPLARLWFATFAPGLSAGPRLLCWVPCRAGRAVTCTLASLMCTMRGATVFSLLATRQISGAALILCMCLRPWRLLAGLGLPQPCCLCFATFTRCSSDTCPGRGSTTLRPFGPRPLQPPPAQLHRLRLGSGGPAGGASSCRCNLFG